MVFLHKVEIMLWRIEWPRNHKSKHFSLASIQSPRNVHVAASKELGQSHFSFEANNCLTKTALLLRHTCLQKLCVWVAAQSVWKSLKKWKYLHFPHFPYFAPKWPKIATFSFRRNNETKLFFPLKNIPMRLFWVVFKHCTSVFLIHISDMTLNFSKLSKIQQQRNEQ